MLARDLFRLLRRLASRVVRTTSGFRIRPTPRTRLRFEPLEERLAPAVDPTFRGGLTVTTADLNGDGIPDLIGAPGANYAPRVVIYNGATGTVINSYLSLEESFVGGVFVAVGDVTGDGKPEVVTGAGAGGGSRVTVADPLTGKQLASFFAYAPDFVGGVRVAVDDTDGDGVAEIITAPGDGGGPHVRVFDGTGKNLGRDFLAYDESFRGGLAVAAGDADGDGSADIFTTPGVGGAPHVKIFSGKTGGLLESYFASDPALRGGSWVAAGDVDGNGTADAVVGAGVGDLPGVRLFAGHGTSFAEWQVYEPTFLGGVRVATGDTNGDAFADVITGPGDGGGPRVTMWDGYTFAPTQSLFAVTDGSPLGFGTKGEDARIPLLDGRTLLTPAGGDFAAAADLLRRFTDQPNEFGVYEVDDAAGRVGSLLPGDAGYAAAALAHRRVLFTPTDGPGLFTTFTMKAGKRYAAYLVRGDATPVFAFPAANEGGTDQFRTGVRNRAAFEDTRGTDDDKNDAIVGFRAVSEASEIPGVTTPPPPIFPPPPPPPPPPPVTITPFPTDLSGWTVAERGGAAAKRGTITAPNGVATLREGDSFVTTLSRSFTVPANPTPLAFRFNSLGFDTTDPGFVNDAFEVALLDAAGNPLTATFAAGRDAFFNATDGTAAQTAAGVTVAGQTVTVSLSAVPASTVATLVFRLVNNDTDTASTITLAGTALPTPTITSSQVKFFVADAATGRAYRYGEEGLDASKFDVPNAGTLSGAASNPAGDKVWLVDSATRRVSVFGPAGGLLSSWVATDATDPQGVTVNNGDLWLVDRGSKKVRRYVGGMAKAADAAATSSFPLDAANASPSDLVTDGATIWVTDDAAADVFVYSAEGSLLGRWELDGDNASPSGITRNPAGGTDLWVLDRAKKAVFQYPTGASARSGQLAAAGTFRLGPGVAAPEGIADPPQSADGYALVGADGRAVFDTADDFRGGTLFNVTAIDAAGEIRLNTVGETEIPPVIWVANSGEGSVSRYDTRTGKEVGRYRTGPESLGARLNPSRTAVAGDGSAWVANRSNRDGGTPSSVVRVMLEGFIDRNGNGVEDTSTDANGNGVIEAAEMLPWDANADGQPDDERIAAVIGVGRDRNNPSSVGVNTIARAVALDADDNVWVGLFNLRQYEVYDGVTGALLGIVPVRGTPYGAVVDGGGVLWGATRDGAVDRIDTAARTALPSVTHGGDNYGITIDPSGAVWTATYSQARLHRIDPDTLAVTTYSAPGVGALRGVGVADNGDVWVASNSPNALTRFRFAADGVTLADTTSVAVGNTASAAVIDADGFVWTTTYGDNKIWKIDPETVAVVAGYPINSGPEPYNYSDMTGRVRLQVTQRTGTWTETIDAGRGGAAWAGVGLEANTPAGTSTVVRVRSSDNAAALASLAWRTIEPDTTYPDMTGRYLQVEVGLRSRNPDATPSVRSVAAVSVPLPSLTVGAPLEGTGLPADSTVVLDGLAVAAQPEFGPALAVRNRITAVTVNGRPVEVLDETGTFYTRVTVQPGENRFTVVAYDEYGQSTTVVRTVMSENRPTGSLDLSQFADLTATFRAEYARTSFRAASKSLYADIAVRNLGQYPAGVPLLVGVKNISDPAVRVLDAAGTLPDGTPYYDFTGLVTGGATQLSPNAATGTLSLAFANPNRGRFTYDLVFLGVPNRGPAFTTIPELEASPGRAYSYDADATDPDGDALSFALLGGPVGMTLDATTGLLSWTPTETQLGNFPVSVQVSDGRGGVATQNFTVASVANRPNRPPVFTTLPVVDVEFGAAYRYAADALDPDRDTLTFTLGVFPTGMTIDGATGVISWTPVGSQIGHAAVTVVVSDGRGGTATQAFEVCVDAGNNRPPLIVSDPVTTVRAGSTEVFRYAQTFDAPLGAEWSGVTTTEGVQGYAGIGTVGDAFAGQFLRNATGGSAIGTAGLRTTLTLRDLPSHTSVDLNFLFAAIDSWDGNTSSAPDFFNVEVDGAGVFRHTFENATNNPADQTYVPPAGVLLTPRPFAQLGFGAGGFFADSAYDLGADPVFTAIPHTASTLTVSWYADGGGWQTDESWAIDNLQVILRKGRAAYTCDVDALDPDGGATTYTLTQNPAGMTIDAATGVISWSPAGGQGGPNLVTNGDFSAGNSGFTSQYVYRTGGNSTEGEYTVRTNPSTFNGAFAAIGDHTTGTGNMLVVNGHTTPNKTLWAQTVAVTPNTTYTFSAWVTTLVAGGPARLQVRVNGQVVEAGYTLPATTGSWVQFTATWSSAAATTAAIEIEDLSFAFFPNDFAVDDIAFAVVGVAPGQSFPVAVRADDGRGGSDEQHFTVTVIGEAGAREFDPVVEWAKGTFTVRPDSNQVMMTPAVIDLNADGTPDIVFSTFTGGNYNSGGLLRAISGRDGADLWTVTDSRYLVAGRAGVAVGDIDADGRPEIIAEHESDRLIAFEADGTFKWMSPAIPGGVGWGSAALADLDHDGTPEIVVGSTVLNADGTLRWSGSNGRGDNGVGPLSLVADLDRDGSPEVVAGNTAYHADGSVYWTHFVGDGFTAIGNFNADPFPEIVYVSGGTVSLLTHDGATIWGPVAVPGGGRVGAPTIADFDNDGRPEIGVAGGDRYVVFETDGTVKWQSQTQDHSSNVTGSSVFDFDGDGQAEVVYGDELFLRIYRGTDGTVLYSLPNPSGTTYEYPIIADVDGDGNAEIVVISNNYAFAGTTGIRVIGDRNNTWVNTRKVWNQHTYHITNVNDDGTIPAHEANSWEAYNTYRLNVLTTGFDPRSAPDLLPTGVSQATAANGDVTFTATVRNDGAPVLPGVSVAFYDGNPAKGGRLIGTAPTTTRLTQGQSESVPLTVPAGSVNDLWVRADDPAAVPEFDETNNALRARIDLDPVNYAPRQTHPLTATELAATVRTAYRLVLPVLDPDGDAVTFDVVSGPTGLMVHPTLGVVAWFPLRDQLGDQQVVIRATDSAGHVTLVPFTLTVSAPNTAPVFSTTPPAGPAAVGKPFEYRAAAQDAEQDALTFTLVSPLPGMSLTADGVFTWTPTAAGPATVTIRASDGTLTTDQTFTLTVPAAAANHDPRLRVEAPATAWLGRQYVARLVGSDADGDPVRFALVSGPTGMAVDAVTGILTWTPGSSASETVRVSATDGRGGAATAEFVVTITGSDTNRAPVVTSNPPRTGSVGGLYAYDLAARDPDGGPILWTLVAGPQGMSLDPERGTLRWVPAADQTGPVTVTVRATDQMFTSGDQNFTIDVSCSNAPPAITSRPPTLAYANDAYIYAVRATDPENDPLTFTLTTAPTGMAFVPGTSLIRWTATTAQAGPQNVVVRVTDQAGNATTQAFTITVSTESPNRPPVIGSRPRLGATLGRAYTYTVAARDPDGDALTYTLTARPDGMTIDAAGRIDWTPTAAMQATVTVEAADGRGGVAVQSFTITARANQAPTLDAIPNATAALGGTFRAAARATDPEGDPLTFALDQAPTGMTIDPQGRIIWTPSGGPRGEVVRVSVADADGLTATREFTVTLVADTEAPRVTIALSYTVVDQGTPVRVSVRATDNVGVANLTLTVRQGTTTTDVALNASGEGTFTPAGAGRFTFTATATDGGGNTATADAELRSVNPADQTGPDVAFTRLVQMTGPGQSTTLDPNAGPVTITYVADVYGSVSDPDNQLDSWKVLVAVASEVDPADLNPDLPIWRTIGTGTSPVTDGKLATFDPTTQQNDRYILIVVAYDTNGRGTVKGIEVDVTGSAKLGDFRLEFTDLTLPLAGIPITVGRVYDTKESGTSGDFGYGWRLGLRDARIRETVSPNETFFPGKTKVYLTAPDGTRVGFTYQERNGQGSWFGQIWQAAFDADRGNPYKLTIPDTTVLRGGILGALGGNGINPSVYRLTAPDGTVYEYDQFAGLQNITDRNSNVVTFTATGIRHSSGVSIAFERDGAGRITAVVDPAGNRIAYTYDAGGNLASAKDQLGNTTRFTYRSDRAHYLDEVIDPLGRRAAKTEYDAAGRVVAVTDGDGHRTEQAIDPATFTETVKDGRGNPTVVTYNDRGNVVRSVQHSAAGDVVSQYFFDDPANPDKVTKVIDPRGGTTATTYDTRGNVTSVTTADGTTRTTYDAANHVTSVTDPLGHTTSSVYDAAGNLIRVTDPSGASRTVTWDAQGRPRSVTDTAGGTTLLGYDASTPRATPKTITHPDGTVRTSGTNSFGKVTDVTDEKGNKTTYEYGPTGLLKRSVDANGGVTISDYDALGNRTSVQDPVGSVTTFRYDATRHVVEETDPLGNKTLYAYDEGGNLVRQTDRNGRARAFEYDAANRLLFERWYDPSGTLARTITSAYDGAGNLTSQADPDSVLTWTYDSLNRIRTVSNAGTPGVPAVTLTYVYDGAGNVLTVTDDAGTQAASTYDARNLLGTRSWQGAGVDPVAVRFDYNVSGQLTLIDRAAGGQRSLRTAIGYDPSRGRVASMVSTNGAGATLASFGYTYDSAGLVKTYTDGSQTAAYGYDRTGQLLSADYSDNSAQPDESFHYDANGNPNSAGYVVGVGNRVASDGAHTFVYDREGNLASKTETATGRVTEYTYDHRNRLVRVEERSASGVTLSASSYTYDTLGRRIAVVENGATTRTVYDGQSAWADFAADGTVAARYLFGSRVDENLARWRPGEGVVWYLTDRRGSVTDLVSPSGAVINTVTYAAFGTILTSSNTGVADRFAFTGREVGTATGLYYYRARYLDPTSGRFVSQDPSRFDAGDPNLYRYVANDPINWSDPLGLELTEAALLRSLLVFPEVLEAEIIVVGGEAQYAVVVEVVGGSNQFVLAKSFWDVVGALVNLRVIPVV